MNLPHFAITHRTITIVGITVAMIWGTWVLFTLPRREDPEYQGRTCVVSTAWPGATAEKMERLVTDPMEKTIKSIADVRRVRSQSKTGLSTIYVDLEQRVRHPEVGWAKIRAKIAQMAANLPQGVYPPEVDSDFGDTSAMILAVYPLYAQKYTPRQMEEFAKLIKNELNTIKFMGKVDLLGVQEEVINLEVDAGTWSRLNLKTDDLQDALQQRNIVSPGGSIDTPLSRFTVRLTGEFETVNQIEHVVLGTIEETAPTYLKDMGIQVRRTYEDPPNYFCRYTNDNYSGKCIMISFTMKKGGNIVELGNAVRDRIALIEGESALAAEVTDWATGLQGEMRSLEVTSGPLEEKVTQILQIVEKRLEEKIRETENLGATEDWIKKRIREIEKFRFPSSASKIRDPVELRQQIAKITEEIQQARLPGDVKISVVCDQPKQVDSSVKNFLSNIYQGMFIVLLVGIMLSGMTLSLIMAISIPLSLVTSIGFFPFFGVELEQVSIAALIVALGMLVDNSIEISDNIHRMLLEGKSRFEAAWQGCQEVAFSILSATLTTVAAFAPFLVIQGELGEFIYSLPVILSVSLMVSWVVALTVTTLLCYKLVEPTAVQGGVLAVMVRSWIALVAILAARRQKRNDLWSFSKRLGAWVWGKVPITPGEHQEGFVKQTYVALLQMTLRHRFVALLIMVLVFISPVFYIDQIGDQFFPYALRNQFVVDIWLPQSVPISRTDQVCSDIERLIFALSKTPYESRSSWLTGSSIVKTNGPPSERLKNMASFIGGSAPRFYISFDPQPFSQNFAQIIVNTHNPYYSEPYIIDLRRAIAGNMTSYSTGEPFPKAVQEIVKRMDVSDVRVDVRKLNLGTATGAPVAIRVVGKDPKVLRPAVEKVKQLLYSRKEMLNIYDDWGSPIHQVEVNIDSDLANLAGVTNQNVARTMNTFLSGQYLTDFREGDRSIPVFLRLPKEQRQALNPLQDFYVEGRSGRVPIDGISEMSIHKQEGLIIRWNQERAITVFGFVRELYMPNNLLAQLVDDLEQINRAMPPGNRLEIGGEWQDTIETQDDFNKCFVISVLLIVLILVCQYDDIWRPLLILVTLPMGWTASLLGLWLTNWALNFMAILGIVSLSGIVLNDAIVLIDFTDRELKKGVPLEQGLVTAARMRLGPIFLTTLTTIGGLLPLSLWGGPLWIPMSNTVIFGLMGSTLLTLFVIPTLYLIMVKDLKIKMIREEL